MEEADEEECLDGLKVVVVVGGGYRFDILNPFCIRGTTDLPFTGGLL